METIKTFVFLDLETTGLPHLESSPTKITEIALIAVDREHLLQKHNDFKPVLDLDSGASNENKVYRDFLPRVLNKLNFTVYPCKVIQPTASVLSGLTNENLEQQRHFDDKICQMIELFLERLNKPICLVAHNGIRFDFPVLQSEVSKLGKTFSDYVFCADSLPGFREVLSDKGKSENSNSYQSSNSILTDVIPLNNKVEYSSILPKCGWSNEEYNHEMVQATELAEKFSKEHCSFNVEELEFKIQAEMKRIRKTDEHTPTRKVRKPTAEQIKNERGVRRKLLNDQKQPKRLFNMKSLYENLTGKELVDTHRAEADALALLECVTVVGRPILEWIDNNRIAFRSIKKIW